MLELMCPCSDFMDISRHLINCCIIIIIIINDDDDDVDINNTNEIISVALTADVLHAQMVGHGGR